MTLGWRMVWYLVQLIGSVLIVISVHWKDGSWFAEVGAFAWALRCALLVGVTAEKDEPVDLPDWNKR